MAASQAEPLNRRIAIVGGSVAGLFTGILLSKLGNVQTVTILEHYAEDQQQDQGAGIRLSDNVIDTIRDATGLQPEDYCLKTDRLINLSTAGEVLMNQTTVAWCTNWRQLFLALLAKFQKTPKSIYRHGCDVHELTDNGDSVTVIFTNEDGQANVLEADIVIGADGLSSTTRRLLAPGSKREYAGYVILRGLVRRDELSAATLEIQSTAGAFCFGYDSQIISYWVPAGDGPVSEETQVWNWGWYCTLSSDQLADVMLDKEGRRRRWALPAGAMRDDVADRIRAKATADLPAAMAEGVLKTQYPFVQVISDMIVPENVFMNGKAVLIGDAVAGQRPHTASSCTQCCYHGLLIVAWLEGKISVAQMSEQAREYSSILVEVGKELGICTQSTTMAPTDKARSFFGTWFPTQARLSAMFENLTGLVRVGA